LQFQRDFAMLRGIAMNPTPREDMTSTATTPIASPPPHAVPRAIDGRELAPAIENVVIHYHEVALKGNNRIYFERRLQRNILRATASLGMRSITRLYGRLLCKLAPDANIEGICTALQKIFGIAYFAPAYKLEQDIDKMSAMALVLLAKKQFTSFKVETKRAQKHFHMTSPQINAHVGEVVLRHFEVRVDLHAPEVTVWIEVADNYCLMYTDRIPGPGGLPVGSAEQAVCLLSGGIDSPVAAYRLLKRGVNLIYVHFHSAPFTTNASQELVERLVQLLTEYQQQALLYFIPFAEIQQHIVAHSPPGLRVILYRREMFRLAERVAHKHRALALLTGENVSQVASQTLSNLRVINDATKLPVLRPLAGDDKQEIVKQARQIGTFPISTEPFEDCCSLFVPANPETHAKLDRVLQAEAKLDMEPLRQAALSQAVEKIFKHTAAQAFAATKFVGRQDTRT